MPSSTIPVRERRIHETVVTRDSPGCQGNHRKAAEAKLPVQGSRPGLPPESWFADEHPYRISHGIKVDCPVFLLPEFVLILVILFRQFQ